MDEVMTVRELMEKLLELANEAQVYELREGRWNADTGKERLLPIRAVEVRGNKVIFWRNR
jgi:hypothetical protein